VTARSFIEAREFIHKLRLKNVNEWYEYCKSGKKPEDIPSNPDKKYKTEWKGMGDWLGTGHLAPKNRVYRPFLEARKLVHLLGLKNREEWNEYCKSGRRPADIPASPERPYKKDWKGWGDWLGTGTIATLERRYRPFLEAREFVHKLGLKNQEEWSEYCKSGKKPQDIPAAPDRIYQQYWNDWFDWLGYEESVWSVRRVKELLSGLIESKIIYQWDEAVLYSFLLRKGLLNLYGDNRHAQFFKNLIKASRTEKGRKIIEEYANSDSEDPPDLSKVTSIGTVSQYEEQEIEKASSKEIAQLVKQDGEDPLDYGEIKTAKQILASTNVLESINVDEEAMQFYLDYYIDGLWKRAFRDKEQTILDVKKEGYLRLNRQSIDFVRCTT
jgi:hypothetical protein